MKKIIYTFVFFVSGIIAHAQCSQTYSGTGIYPASLPSAWEQVNYLQELDFTFPADTVINGFSVHIDSMKVKSLSGFPGTNFGYTCGNGTCVYVPNTSAKFQGCFTISGTAPAGSAGDYKLYVDLDAYIQTPFGQQVYTIQDSSVTFSVNACNVVTSIAVLDTMLCVGALTKLSATGTGKIKWFLNGNLQDSGVSVQTGKIGNWMAILIDSVGCVDTSNTIAIGNYPAPVRPVLSNTAGTNDVSCNIIGLDYMWRNNGVVDSTLNGKKEISILKDGNYQVSYQDSNGCWSAWSDSLNLKFVGIASVNRIQAEIYPNPATDKIYINVMDHGSAVNNGTLVNMEGQVLSQFHVQKDRAEVSVASLPAGIYLIQLQGSSGSRVYKFTVKR